ncbi:dol-P-Man:Man(5)GlcNAc(2)-PP-Dol alpha-1,3-mannosyltransferase isoform X2 [Beta vulgaris subsp. vulgaris]|uniref:dol-P-Man:Man(5)GlcNAc(2)-PP-Dol alpha-1,3-mannosyltransferase isoform X2 n=1 Tax=Beta vulgaris subsp. vulgaris TaxID=3555 RepID=UPI0020367376|nr:dol-P-Man:Man(5)GlcNAc(2)-PP-Dol alpha-1,3-mannosyltransferase isoform X2 [Beta vulgaris subsp. vulgaris]
MGDKLRSKERKFTDVSSNNGEAVSKMPTTLLDKANRNLAGIFACALLVFDAVFVFIIIAYVPYTKIDWDAYMSQVSMFLNGERDYGNIEGDTGPLVYPAGFLYVYSAIQYITGGLVHPAQILFGALYIINLAIVFFIYIKTDVLPWWALSLLCLSKRVHSIFVLRLFNDCIATTLLHAALATLLCQKWCLGLIIFSFAVSIKMNVLLYAPSLLLIMLKAMDISGTIVALGGAAIVQILLGLPFLVTYPVAYISGAFNLGRVFIHFWSVNFKFVPEPIFVSKRFAVSLLIIHLGLLATFAHKKWCKYCNYHVCWKLHRYCLCPFTTLSVLLLVLLQLAVFVVEDAFPYVDAHSIICGS